MINVWPRQNGAVCDQGLAPSAGKVHRLCSAQATHCSQTRFGAYLRGHSQKFFRGAFRMLSDKQSFTIAEMYQVNCRRRPSLFHHWSVVKQRFEDTEGFTFLRNARRAYRYCSALCPSLSSNL